MAIEMQPEDYDSIVRAGQELHQRGWRTVFSLTERLQSWAWLVTEVENGYSDMVEEYSNDLYSRLWIELAWPMFTERVRIAHQPRLAELDDRFRAATIHDEGRAVGHFRKPEDAALWWTQRRPRMATGQFAIDLGMS